MSETSQNAEVMEVLKDELRELGVKKGLHFFKTEEALRKKIADVKEKQMVAKEEPEVEVVEEAEPEVIPEDTGERMVAPRMVTANLNEDTRTKKAREIEAKYPGTKCVYKKSGTSADQLAAIGLRHTGEYLKNDMVCITDKESFEEWQAEKNSAQRRKMDAVDSIGTKIKSHTAKAKTPPKQEQD